MANQKFEVRSECWGKLSDVEPHCREPSRGVEFCGTPPQLGSELGEGGFVAFFTLRLNWWPWGPSVGSEGSVSWPGTLWHSAPSVGESYMYWDFTNSKRCKIPAIRRARVCDGIEFSLALSQYSQWRIILHGSRNRHFYVLLIFYLKLNCRYRVINKIHPCLSQKKKKKVWSFPTHGILYFSYHI